MGRTVFFGLFVFSVAIASFLAGTVALLLVNYGLSPYGQTALDAMRLAGLVALAAIMLIVFDFAVFSSWGRAGRRVRYEPIRNMKVAVGLTAYNDELSIGHAVEDFK